MRHHPWGDFLFYRRLAILWMKEKMGYDDARIAENLSMDETQVYLIRTSTEFSDHYEKLMKEKERKAELAASDEVIQKVTQDISNNHNKIIDDWCKAYLAQLYQEGVDLKPGDFILNEQHLDTVAGSVFGKKYWFEKKCKETI